MSTDLPVRPNLIPHISQVRIVDRGLIERYGQLGTFVQEDRGGFGLFVYHTDKTTGYYFWWSVQVILEAGSI